MEEPSGADKILEVYQSTCRHFAAREMMLTTALVEAYAQVIGWRVEARRHREIKAGWARGWGDLSPDEQENCRIDARNELRREGVLPP